MGGRNIAPLLLVAGILIGACSEGANDAPTAPDLVIRSACSFTTISSLVKGEFGANSPQAGLATDMKNAGAQTAQATTLGYQILAAVGAKYDGSQTSTTNASALTVALLKCMNIGGATVPSASVFDAALGATGAFGVRGLGATDNAAVTSHDGAWLLEPPAGETWQSLLLEGTGAILAYGSPVNDGSFTNDVPKSGVFDWSTLPQVTFNAPGIVVGECTADPQFLQHNPAGTTAEVLGFVDPGCPQPSAGLGERAPRNLAERVIRLLGPAPAYATLLTTTGSGGSKRTLSPFQVIGPTNVNLAAQFAWKKAGNTVGKPFVPTIEYQIRSQAGTRFLQDYVLIWLEALGNHGTNVEVCNNWAYTNAEGVAHFPTAYLNKAGGYTMISKTTGTSSKPEVTEGDLPSVPAGASLSSPLINVKNGSPGTCVTYHPGDALPPAPGPNGFKAVTAP